MSCKSQPVNPSSHHLRLPSAGLTPTVVEPCTSIRPRRAKVQVDSFTKCLCGSNWCFRFGKFESCCILRFCCVNGRWLGVFILIFCFGSLKMGWVLCCVLCKYMLHVLLGGCLFFENFTPTWGNDPIWLMMGGLTTNQLFHIYISTSLSQVLPHCCQTS